MISLFIAFIDCWIKALGFKGFIKKVKFETSVCAIEVFVEFVVLAIWRDLR